jgi:4-hydroxy-2-oxoheptanedioate aldolase
MLVEEIMRSNRVRDCWAEGKAAISGFLSIGNSYSAEVVAMSGYDCVTVDLQHAMTDVQTMIGMLQAISATPATPFVRVPGMEPSVIMKALDAGSYGLICPLVNSAEEAEAFVAASTYPSRGYRSFGPARGLLYGGDDYLSQADSTIVRLAMVETRESLANLEGICSVDGLDGIFIGPSDLGLSFGKGASADPTDTEVRAAIADCLKVAKRFNKRVGLFCPSGRVAALRIDEGFDFVVAGSDVSLLKQVLSQELNAARSKEGSRVA